MAEGDFPCRRCKVILAWWSPPHVIAHVRRHGWYRCLERASQKVGASLRVTRDQITTFDDIQWIDDDIGAVRPIAILASLLAGGGYGRW